MRTSTVVSAPFARSTGLLVACPAILPDFVSRTTNSTAVFAAPPSLRNTACTRTVFPATSGAACTEMKCGVPERINSTESKMPGMYRCFSKSKPLGYAGPTASRSAPTRINDLVAAGLRIAGLASK